MIKQIISDIFNNTLKGLANGNLQAVGDLLLFIICTFTLITWLIFSIFPKKQRTSLKNLLKNLSVYFSTMFEKQENLVIKYGINIVNEGGNELCYKRLLKSMNNLHHEVLNIMMESNLKIIYTNDKTEFIKVAKITKTNNCRGFYWGVDNVIYVLDTGSLSSWYEQEQVLYHELGHFVDYIFNSYRYRSSSSKKFREAFNTEKGYYKIDYYTKNVKEYFAQGFAEYYYNHTFRTTCPLTSSFIKDVIENSLKKAKGTPIFRTTGSIPKKY